VFPFPHGARCASVLPAMDLEATAGTDSLESLGSPDEQLRAIIADDDPLARRMIRDSLQKADVVVIAEAQNGREAVELCLYYRPDVVLMDVVMPELDGIAATRAIIKEIPGQTIVILTSSDDDGMGLIGLKAGAVGFLSKDLDIDKLPRVLQGARRGEAAISRRLGMRLVEHYRSTQETPTGMRPVKSPLTAREWEVVDLLVEGASTDQIADTLVLSIETVRSHVKNILRKLDARSRAEAVAVAQKMRGAGGGAA
jgi:NarL family two-component system response regulator LiaR